MRSPRAPPGRAPRDGLPRPTPVNPRRTRAGPARKAVRALSWPRRAETRPGGRGAGPHPCEAVDGEIVLAEPTREADDRRVGNRLAGQNCLTEPAVPVFYHLLWLGQEKS